MLKKRIYLPDKCLGDNCEHYTALKERCKTCPIFREDLAERTERLKIAHRKAALVFYHKNKTVKRKNKDKKVAIPA